MSSPRDASPSDAIIVHRPGSDDVGLDAPLRLPQQQQAEFVRQFNQLYGPLGLHLRTSALDQPAADREPSANDGGGP